MKTLKIVVLLVLTALFFQDANAQIARNSFIIGGNLNFASNSGTRKVTGEPNQSKPTTFNATINPKIGYFVADNFAIGLDLNFTVNSLVDTSVGSNSTYTTTQLLTGPFVRYYFGLNEDVFLFLEGSAGFGLTSTREQGRNLSISVVNAGVGPGLAFFVNDFIAVEGIAKYNYVQSTFTSNYAGTGDVTVVDMNHNINFQLGFQFYFRAVEGGRQ